jgi:hypothetical protein
MNTRNTIPTRAVRSSALLTVIAAGSIALLSLIGCGDDDESEADRKGVGAQCVLTTDCATGQTCLAFKGGYCGLADCTKDLDCPAGSACVTHTDAKNYCFRICAEKTDCNRNRSVENESNCVGSVTFVAGTGSRKACIPPSGS